MSCSSSLQREPNVLSSDMKANGGSTGPPPAYYESFNHEQALSEGSIIAADFHFFKASKFGSKARLRSADGREFHLEADVNRHEDSRLSLYLADGRNSKNGASCLGSVSFPSTHNDFRIHTSGVGGSAAPAEMIQVKARIGHPHPLGYIFKLPGDFSANGVGSTSRQSKEVIWNRFFHPSSNTFGYQLVDTTWKTPIATWSLVQGERYTVILKWHVEPRSRWEEVVVLLSFLGCLTRLKVKGREEDSMLRANGRARWGAFWFMAILGTAGVA